MRKFIKLLSVYVCILALIVLFVNCWYIALDHRDPNNTNKFNNVPDHIQICNFGSSHGLYGVNYEGYEDTYTCFNFALNSQTLSYDARILEYYQEHLQEGTIVFVTISYNSFFGIPETEYADFETKNMRYYSFLPANLIKNYSIKTNILSKFPSLYAYETLPLALIGHYLDADTSLSGWEAVADEYHLPDNTTHAIKNHLITGKLDENGERIINQEEIDALYDILEICEAKGAVPILVTPPFSLVYNNLIDIRVKDFAADFEAVINSIVSDTGVTYYNYAKDIRFNKDFTYFRDTDHLNKMGAKLFTNILMEEIVYPMWE